MLPRDSSDERINFIETDGHLISVPASKIAQKLNQNFQWTNEIVVDDKQYSNLYLLKSSLLNGEHLIKVMKQQNWKAIILSENKLFFLTDKIVKQSFINSTWELSATVHDPAIIVQMNLRMKKLSSNHPIIAEQSMVDLLIKLLKGPILDPLFLKDTITQPELDKRLEQVRQNHRKLALKKINDVVGYGVVALGHIEANSYISIYSGLLTSNKNGDDYAAAASPHTAIIANQYRNFAGFISHAFSEAKDSEAVGKADFEAINKDPNWQRNILWANTRFNKTEVCENKAYRFVTNTEPLQPNQILATDYEVRYWIAKNVVPCLLTLNGTIIDPSTYVCKNSRYNHAFPGNKPIPPSITDVSVFKLVAKDGEKRSEEKCRLM